MKLPSWAGGGNPSLSREKIASKIKECDAGWSDSDEALVLSETLRWRPDLVSDGGRLLHAQLSAKIPKHIGVRLEAAFQAGCKVDVALPLEGLWDLSTVEWISRSDSCIHLFDAAAIPQSPLTLLNALTDKHIKVPADLRGKLGKTAWQRCRAASGSYEKGRRLEELLAFLLQQSREMRVVERNLRTETEEIDLVAQASIAGLARCWVIPGSPFILVEAKNWSCAVDKPVVSEMLTKIRGYRGTTKIGILVGACGFTSDAKTHEIRYAAEDGTVVFIGPEELASWIEAPDIEEYFEALVRRAMLR